MHKLSEIKKSLLVSLWFMFLTFPIMVIRVNPVEKVVEWRWRNMVLVGLGSFVLSFVWRYMIRQKEAGLKKAGTVDTQKVPLIQRVREERRLFIPLLVLLSVLGGLFPFIFSAYQVNIMTTALMYVVLGLGLNIVVGLAGLLDLGYVAFYAVGAYTTACLIIISASAFGPCFLRGPLWGLFSGYFWVFRCCV